MYHIAPTMLCADLFQMRESMDVLDKLGKFCAEFCIWYGFSETDDSSGEKSFLPASDGCPAGGLRGFVC